MTTLMGCQTLATVPHTALRDTKGNRNKGFLHKKKENSKIRANNESSRDKRLGSDQLAAMEME